MPIDHPTAEIRSLEPGQYFITAGALWLKTTPASRRRKRHTGVRLSDGHLQSFDEAWVVIPVVNDYILQKGQE